MEYSWSLYLLVGCILIVGTTLQALVGFAAGLLAIPLLLSVGAPLADAIAINLSASLVQLVASAYWLRGDIDPRAILRPLAIRLAALPLGVGLLWWAGAALDQERVKQLVGLLLLGIVLLQWRLRVEPQERLAAGWQWLAFGSSGFLAGCCGMGGPPMVLWVLAHRWTSARQRAFLFWMFLGSVPIQALMMLAVYGEPLAWTLLFGLAATPFGLAGALLGQRLSRWAPPRAVQRLSYAVLVVIALEAIAAPWFG